MRVLTIAMACDEEALIPYFVRHYMQVGDVTIFDDHSADDTVSAARAEGAIVLPVVGQEQDDPEYRLLRAKNHAWKPVRALYDWVIAVDVDEFLHDENLFGALWQLRDRGATVLKPQGYQMVAACPPSGGRPIIDQIRRGVPHTLTSKPCCFNPQRVVEINYTMGAHAAEPTGDVRVLACPGLKLLHYHYLGVDWVLSRYASRRRRRGGAPSLPGLRDYNQDTPERVAANIAALEAAATEVV